LDQRDAERVLAEWRRLERDLETLDPASDEAEALIADIIRLRDQYGRLIDARRADAAERRGPDTETGE
jgi:hypothetical protein